MAYEVLARKWRPQQFADVVGQDHVTQTLVNAIETERLAHAYLFVGPRGVGKTSVARILAKSLNCAQGPTAQPCGRCDACREITAGTSLDVLEIDGASNNGVDQVRDLRDTVKYAPARGRFKIYIIDEVHMLSTAAFNALLKTLEEPPAHVKFVFATTEPQKILPTILSRCQRFDLRRIPVGLIVERLARVAAAEKVEVEPDALLAIARGAEGGLRDAESALDQLVSFRGRHIREEDVLAVFGLVARATLEELAEAVLKGEVPKLIGLIAGLDEAGKDLQRVAVELLEHFRNLLVCLHVQGPSAAMDLADAQMETLRRQATLTQSERLLRLMQILAECVDQMRSTLSRRTLLEMALIRSARAAVVVSLDEILRQINALRAQLGEAGAGLPPAVPAEPAAVPAADAAPKPERPREAPRPAVADGPADEREPPATPPADELRRLVARWPEVIARVGKMSMAAKNALRDARPLKVEPRRVVIGLDPEFADELKGVEGPRNSKPVEHVIGNLLNRTVRVEFQLADPAACAAEAEPPEAGNGREEAEPAEPPRAEPRGKRSVHEWAKEEAVRKALDMFGGTIADTRE